MLTHNLGYPRIGSHRELKRACEDYWSSRISRDELLEAARAIRRNNWQLQRESDIDLIPCNDFPFYDHVLDLSLMVGAIPARYRPLLEKSDSSELDLYFAMARGYQKDGLDLIAMEMTKWFDTNYHYLVPEFTKDQTFSLTSRKALDEFQEARSLGFNAKPVLIGPVSYLLLGKEKEPGFNRLDLLDRLLPVYLQILGELQDLGAKYVQIDEPFLALDLQDKAKHGYVSAYAEIAKACPELKIILATYFAGLDDNTRLAASLPVSFLHLDLARAPAQLDAVLSLIPPELGLSLGVVDGRNVWKNDFVHSLALIAKAVEMLGSERVALAPSCSLLHAPCDLTIENNEVALPGEIKRWLAFARQKLDEVVTLKELAQSDSHRQHSNELKENLLDMESRRQSVLIHKPAVKQRLATVLPGDLSRQSPFSVRQAKQHALLNLPLYPTTTIGSFPQTDEVRKLRLRFRKGELTQEQYEGAIRRETEQAIRWQEDVGLDVLVHGEFERNDMVEYFGELLEGFAFTANGWVQSYGSRCVKPPIIYGDVERRAPMTVKWSQYAQSLTAKPVKGMLTGPVTILQWSSVRDDQPRSITAKQIALAIRDEVCDLEKAGIRIIQIDEPAIREGLPLRKAEWKDYLRWAVDVFRLASSGVADETQIHTHMCYSEFNDIIDSVAEMDADVITIETSRSQMELLDAFASFHYPNEIGPGVYDIHSPRVPTEKEMCTLLRRARAVLPPRNLWVNPDCGLKTRRWPETRVALANMVAAAKALREQL
ncbi:MAG: 5-methyltetrahydropteroyltriglutamate--homocysteine S-methyltransferase [Betaproteobacteria bacterium]|nr:5-methyltetrahydropteroyltriglutamate--homocysteine S-methyltransferase [Betaproteobacteria bacterium]